MAINRVSANIFSYRITPVSKPGSSNNDQYPRYASKSSYQDQPKKEGEHERASQRGIDNREDCWIA